MLASHLPNLLLASIAVVPLQMALPAAADSAFAAELLVNSETRLRSALVPAASGDTITFTDNVAVMFGGRV